MTENKRDLLNLLVLESDNYSNLQDLEKLSDTPALLKSIPMQPLYMAVKKSGMDQVAQILPSLSKEQKEALLDLDLWHKDALDVANFEFWPKTYAMSKDLKEVQEFAKSESFLLYLKSACNIYTFDVEDPVYPDHDNYFLTEDNLLLVEYHDDYDCAKEIQYIIKNLYGDLGPTKAYKLLFKIVSESHMNLTEEVYQNKKERLREFGFVDYYDALELRANFQTIAGINRFIKSKQVATGSLDDLHKNQKLHSSSITSYKTGMEGIHIELAKLSDQKRIDFLQFNFVRMVNATIALENSLKEGPIAMNRVGKVSKQLIELGFDYVNLHLEEQTDSENLFDKFDFIDFFRVGNSLIYIEQKKLKKAMESSDFDIEKDYFLGAYWNHYMDCSFDENIKLADFQDTKGRIINTFKLYESWISYNKLFIALLPLMGSFYSSLKNIIDEGRITDSFYLNYNLSEIDFEAIILSSFINYTLGNYEGEKSQKMGLTLEEFNQFVGKYFNFDLGEHKIKLFEVFKEDIENFSKIFGMDKIEHFNIYLYQLVRDNLEGYNFNNITREDFKHVGGPILFA